MHVPPNPWYDVVRTLLLACSIALTTLSAGTTLAQSSPKPAATIATPPAQTGAAQRSPDATAAEQVVNTFMADLASGKLEAARQLMTPDAVVMANGQALGVRDGYIDGAAKGDAAALRATQRELLRRDVRTGGDVAWVVSEKRMHGTPRPQGAATEIVVTETMLLARTTGGWKIAHIHWSSRQAG